MEIRIKNGSKVSNCRSRKTNSEIKDREEEKKRNG